MNKVESSNKDFSDEFIDQDNNGESLYERFSITPDMCETLGEIVMATATTTYLGSGNYDSDVDHSDY